MNRQELLYLLPYLLSLALSLGIFTYTWQHRSVRGARLYSWFVAGQTLTILGFILELISPDLEIKLLWDKFQWLTDTFLVILPFLIFSVQFSEYKLRHPRLTWGYWLGVPVLFTLVLLTDNLHHLLYPNPHLSAGYPFPELQYNFTFVVYSYALLYVYAANFYGIRLLIRRALQPHNPHRLQYWTIAIGFLIPITLSILSLFNLYVAPERDISPFSLAIGNLVVAWGLFRYGLFDLVPIARERVLENMSDAIIVVDALNRVADVNQVALVHARRESANVIGHPIQEAFAEWPHLVEQVLNADEGTSEVSAKGNDEALIYELSISPIYDQRKSLIGRIFVAHDITRRKKLEDRYRQLSEELEQRVRERTEDLRESRERYRAVVENQTEFIVRWKPDGTRTFANEAYRRYFGLTPEQTISAGFMPLVAEEDQAAVQAKVSRLISGEVRSETETHRVIKPDGSIAWQEWVDQAVLDQSGQIVEFQSVGRDVTERKRMEDALAASEAELRALFASMTDLVLVVDRNGVYRKIAPTNPELLYKPPEELLGKTLQDVFPAEEAESFLGTIRNVVEEQQTAHIEYQLVIDERVLWFDASISPIGTDSTLWIARDVTERKLAEAALRESEALYRRAIETADAVPYREVYPAEGDVLVEYQFIGDGIRQITGYGPEEFNATLWQSLILEMQPRGDLAGYSVEEAIRRVRSGDNPIWKCDFKIRARDGTIRWVFEAAVEMRDEQGISHGSIGMYQDITERKQAEERMRELARQLISAQEEERKRIAQELHDELGQALTAISLDLGNIEKALPPEAPAGLRDRLIDARSLADEVDEQISELALDLRPSLLDDLGLLPTLKWYLDRYSQRTGIEVAMEFTGMEGRLPDEVETTLYRVIQEALNNIVKHAQASKVDLSLERTGATVTANIRDDGSGFDVEETQNSTSSPQGVGLLGIKDRVSTLGGYAEIRSGTGHGTRIRIEIPL